MVSSWHERAIKRKDARHTALPVIRPPGGSRRNTKRWCRGKVGIEHKPECQTDKGICRHKILVCTECGKHLDWWFPPIGSGLDFLSRPKPDWVTD
jgi:hypothetical protein